MTILQAIEFLDQNIGDKTKGLPDEVFYFISRTTPFVNVDLLIKDKMGRTLLSWRDDQYCGKGWHIPGGIIRFKETFEQRIQKTAIKELGTNVEYDVKPLTIEELIIPEYENRAHFISLLYKCFVPDEFIINNSDKKPQDVGYLKWHENCPIDLLNIQKCYKRFI